MRSYREVLSTAAVRNVLLLGALVRIPFFAGTVMLALHVVQTLHGSYAQAGLLSTVVTLCTAVSGPWRGRLLDRFGLRRTIVPSIVIGAVCWSVGPFVGYVPLLVLAAVAGLFDIPIFTVVRQAVIAATSERTRQSALALESVSVEAAFMVGPVVGVAATAVGSTSLVLFCAQWAHILAGVLVWVLNPPLRTEAERAARAVPRREWFRIEFVALCVGASAAVAVLAGSELTFVSALREFGAQRWLGLVMAVWGFGSLAGGLVYGAMHRSVSTYILLAGLGAVTLPMAFATGPLALGITGFIAGVLCAPTLTASVDQMSRIVPEGGRGEAFGWHGAALTLGNGIGSSLAGVAIDAGGFSAAFGAMAALGIGAGVGLAVLVRLVARSRTREYVSA
ncbi:MFS transporter [Nocardia pseudobrasiliensis]|uniref:Putative MFS family arabinose efflux permease n=1 Tax=Nocardia pseudobrasiliensis TaxID=45979 RepID=A0A370I1F9_9NOCA|nr:MFS transporter [Nocardia pseudobrasiliensis]RDI64588.1 putative MFS family arabinose efflux permease [Nocardia pseudobrasiliensis]